MRETNIRMLCSVVKVDMVYESPDGDLVAFFDATDTSPLMHSEELRSTLRDHITLQQSPYLCKDSEVIYYAALHADGGFLYLGPMCSARLRASDIRSMYSLHGITTKDIRTYPVMTHTEMRNVILLTNSMLENINLQNEELMKLNRIVHDNEVQDMRARTDDDIRNNEYYDEFMYKHTYQEEQLVVDAIRNGDADEAIRLSENMDRDSGRLGSSELQHYKSNATISITVCSRAAINAGVSPGDSYRVSGYYINSVNRAQDPAHILHYRNRAIQELCSMVTEQKTKQRSSGYVERCKDYINKNFRYKIYTEDIAEEIGISVSHLSRLFHTETGMKLQDYISSVRVDNAARLLAYSDMTLSEIAEYVGFPDQSYFGKTFRKFRGMTPKAYRDENSIH